MTIIFVLVYLGGGIIIDFYFYFSITIFIVYCLIIFGLSFLYRPDLEIMSHKPTQEVLLEGKTLQIYWYIFTHNKAGIREIQKALDISSSGTVSYQISKLQDAGILSKDDTEGKYYIKEEVRRGILKFYIRIANKVIPRISLYLIIYIFGFIVYLLFAFISGEEFITDPMSLLLLFFLIFGTIILIFQSIKVWKIKPSS
ncbi:MAG: hypothetical protein ACFE85_11480 [Candidatus Hodarchaeota archaeon]